MLALDVKIYHGISLEGSLDKGTVSGWDWDSRTAIPVRQGGKRRTGCDGF